MTDAEGSVSLLWQKYEQQERTIKALEATIAWLIRQNEHHRFFVHCKGLIERDRPEENEEFIDSFNWEGIASFLEFFEHSQRDPDIPPDPSIPPEAHR